MSDQPSLFGDDPDDPDGPDDEYPFYGGTPPHVRGSDTSEGAAHNARPSVGRWHRRILALYGQAGDGLTCDEVETRCPDGTHQCISARIRELVLAGRIVDSGRRRNTRRGVGARVYVLRSPAPVTR